MVHYLLWGYRQLLMLLVRSERRSGYWGWDELPWSTQLVLLRYRSASSRCQSRKALHLRVVASEEDKEEAEEVWV